MKRILLLIALLNIDTTQACTSCNQTLQQAIYNSTFYPNVGVMLSAFFVLTVIIIVLAKFSTKKYKQINSLNPQHNILNPVPITTAAMVLGIGLGGFMDGIWLHQILQWHEMLSNKVAVDTVIGKSVNMFWDGIFHFFCWFVVIAGIVLLWKALLRKDVDHSKKRFASGLLMGWGLFNVVEGVIDHHVLKLHFVRQASSNPDNWNYLFLGISVLMIMAGSLGIYKRKT